MQVLPETSGVDAKSSDRRTLRGVMNGKDLINKNQLAEMLGLEGECEALYRKGLGTGCLKQVRLGRLTRWYRPQVARHLERALASKDGKCDGKCVEVLEEAKPRMYAVK